MFLIGIVAGVCSGIFGVGGGVILVPSLVFVLRYSQMMATGTSLVALLLPVGFLGVLEYYKAGKITGENIRLGLLISAGMFIGAYLGVRWAIHLPIKILTKAFAILLFAIGTKLLLSN
ncbi:MAG: sulfite exporter TauE/SafE family protein [Myxococcaceae bacterium]|nr:sulfite exporter TauE/SafE family protein [Myxococcaceae bacterium]